MLPRLAARQSAPSAIRRYATEAHRCVAGDHRNQAQSWQAPTGSEQRDGWRPPKEAAPAWLHLMHAKTASRLREQCRSTTVRHRAGRDRSNGTVRGVGADDRARREWFLRAAPKDPAHDYLSSIPVNKWTCKSPKAKLLEGISALSWVSANDTLFHFR